ncbi:hypothetical protein EW146_g5282 [Bondarzewia mesenterica]|uniref:Hydantoinase/oxoprolinase N-terminal domain-containing protein n=1 Tax=Bondarzewia mesenterica TaxID=1095465 RepID=A0A4S4LXS9_9AGAM|nr:hypothetical protein EW146_g5282 [Bondarzewia mesenterica]
MTAQEPTLRVGVDVGGTNTDGVLLDPFATSEPSRGILSWHKSPTTTNPSQGIEDVITTLLANAKVDATRIASVTIGTTHFINAIIEKDQNRLAPVAVIRLCGPYSRDVYPGIDWPSDLRTLICKYFACVDGGLEVDGQLIGTVNESQIAEQCEKIKATGIRSIVVNGVFSPSDLVERQEERVAEWIQKYYPEADVVLSKQVANLGFVERENAAILNASILPFARRTIASFQQAIARLHLSCPVFLTQNDGTILQAHLAARLPIRTFSSGPTNSMCGAAFLVREMHDRQGMLVVDVGGTTTDVGMLLASGLPRQAAAVTEISGVRMNFSCPDVKSIGLGGGSIVRKSTRTSKMTIGPDSVGHHIHERALVFGGDVPTTTDYAIASHPQLSIGDAGLVATAFTNADVEQYQAVVRQMLETIVDRMKTNADDIPVLLVGGGAVIAPDTLKGASKVIKPEYSGVANAIGAAIARVSGTVDTVVNTLDKTTQMTLDEVSKFAVDRAVENGAIRETVQIAEMELLPLQYVANKARVIVKAIGDFDFSKAASASAPLAAAFESEEQVSDKNPLQNSTADDTTNVPVDITSYKPLINERREWIVSEIDLEWIAVGCYILGTGGGGTPYPDFVRLREMVRRGAVVRVISPEDVKDDEWVACGGGMGSPTVGIEKLSANEMMEAQNAIYKYVGFKPHAVIALEIGGGNGLQGMLLGASNHMDIPTVDGDWMGRAYPTGWQITPVVLGGDQALFLPTSSSDGNGTEMLMTSATTEKMIERAFRAALAEMGSYVGCARGPCSGKDMKAWVIENTISLAWRIGRAVALCRARNEIDSVADVIIDEVGGPNSAKVLFKGKIVAVDRKMFKGHVYGEVVIAAVDAVVEGEKYVFKGKMKIPFKNENIVATVVDEEGKEQVVASVPDLICVCDTSSGEAIGTPEYRYGLLVTVIGMQASEKWTSTARGIEIGGPGAFGMDMEYKPLGLFSKPRSVIDEYYQTHRAYHQYKKAYTIAGDPRNAQPMPFKHL